MLQPIENIVAINNQEDERLPVRLEKNNGRAEKYVVNAREKLL